MVGQGTLIGSGRLLDLWCASQLVSPVGINKRVALVNNGFMVCYQTNLRYSLVEVEGVSAKQVLAVNFRPVGLKSVRIDEKIQLTANDIIHWNFQLGWGKDKYKKQGNGIIA